MEKKSYFPIGGASSSVYDNDGNNDDNNDGWSGARGEKWKKPRQENLNIWSAPRTRGAAPPPPRTLHNLPSTIHGRGAHNHDDDNEHAMYTSP